MALLTVMFWFTALLCLSIALPVVSLIPTINPGSSKRVLPALERESDAIKPSRTFVQRRTQLSATVDAGEPSVTADSVVCGAGPAGLLSAIMLAQKFPQNKIQVYDRLPAPPSPTDEMIWKDVAKFYLIGIGGRGQGAMKAYGVWEDVLDVCIECAGRRDWSPGGPKEGSEVIFTDRPVTLQILPRDKMVAVMHQHIRRHYADRIELNYGYQVDPIHFGTDREEPVRIQVSKCSVQSTDRRNIKQSDILYEAGHTFQVDTNLLVVADGASRTVAKRMVEEDQKKFDSLNPFQRIFAEKPLFIKQYIDDNQRVYKTLPMKIPESSTWRNDLNYSARTKGSRLVFDALPANDKGDFCAVLLFKIEDPLAQPDSDPDELRELLDSEIPQLCALFEDEDIATAAKKPPSILPSFRYVGPRLNQGDRTVILGDCAHTVKPYFGLGANSALEDVKVLGEILDSVDDLSDAVHKFSEIRAPEAKTLVRVSRELDRPGLLGFATFLLPLILDSIFHGLAPQFFDQNMIAIMQREDITFQEAATRKRFDRMAQVLVVAVFGTGLVSGIRFLVVNAASTTGQSISSVAGGMVLGIAGLVLLQNVISTFFPTFAPTNIVAMTKGKVTNKDTFLTPLGMGDSREDE